MKWRDDFDANTLEKYKENLEGISAQLTAVRSTVFSLRVHLVAMIIEIGGVIAGAIASSTGPGVVVGGPAIAISLLALAGTYADCQFRVKGDMGDRGRELADFRSASNLDRGGGAVSLPFDTQSIGDWDNWENKNPKVKN